jgi:hypothetical protein
MNVSARHANSYLLTAQYEMPEFDLGNTFNYAEMSGLICPRPFMVERGHHDGVAPDECPGPGPRRCRSLPLAPKRASPAYEFARTYRRYALLGLADRAEIEYFDGPHAIHGEGTFRLPPPPSTLAGKAGPNLNSFTTETQRHGEKHTEEGIEEPAPSPSFSPCTFPCLRVSVVRPLTYSARPRTPLTAR